jgi:hypothetical protein
VTERWDPPGWARLIAYLMGLALFPGHVWMLGGLNWPFLVTDCIVLIGLSDAAVKQLLSLLPGRGGSGGSKGP